MTIGNKIKHIRKLQGEYFKNKPLYNCGGFALGTYNWYLPYEHCYEDWINYFEQFNEGSLTEEEAITGLTNTCVDFMLNDINGIRIIEDESEIKKNEYAIAFRIGFAEDDFHYARRSDEGVWYHKMGSASIQKCDFDIHDRTWDCGIYVYDGPIVLFAIRKDISNEF